MSQEAWSSGGSRHEADDTSDKLYTPEDFAAYAARRETREGAAGFAKRADGAQPNDERRRLRVERCDTGPQRAGGARCERAGADPAA